MSETGSTVEIQNVVASTTIDQELDLESVSADLPNTTYDPDQSPGAIYRTESPRATILLFRSGNIVCTGAKSQEDAHAAIEHLFDDLQSLGIEIPESPEITIQNIVSSADLGHSLNLNAIAIGLGLENTEYEPEQFPGLVYRLEDPSVVVLLFGSGKIVIVGATTPDDTHEAIDFLSNQLRSLELIE